MGGEGVIHLASHRSTGAQVAIKVIDKNKLKERGKQHRIYQEEGALRQIGEHSNIVKLIETFETENNFYMVMEYCSGGDLADHLNKYGSVSEEQARYYMLQICAALSHVHKNGWCHRDIKLENILIAADGSLRLADFGYSCRNTPSLKKVCGTPQYVSPEVLKKLPYDGQKADVWCLGVLLYCMVSARFPFIPASGLRSDLFYQIKCCAYPVQRNEKGEPVSPTLRDLMSKLLCKDPSKRLSLHDLSLSSWMNPVG
jgi:serine/threonine protein kinase